MAVDTRPTVLTAQHNYNLRNQGWPTRFPCSISERGGRTPTDLDPVPHTFNSVGFYPSNADIIFFSKRTIADDARVIGAYSPWELVKNIFGNTPAAKGHFIINAFDRNRQPVSGISGIYDPTRDRTNDRPISVESYAGRVWYMMPTGELYYSQVLTDISRADRCYQEADPTAEDINELIATDGGYLDITGIARGLKIKTVRSELAVFADNGVWAIRGAGDSSFSATGHETSKITDVGAIGPETVVEAEGLVMYWSEGGIYGLVPDQVSGYLTAQNITETTIQQFYLDISEAAKQYARGHYDKQTKKILWFYNDDPDFTGAEFRYKYDSVLVFDLVLRAFYTYSLPVGGSLPFVASVIQKKAGGFDLVTETVLNGADVVEDGSDEVIVDLQIPVTGDVKLKLLTFELQDSDYVYTFSEFRNDITTDWQIKSGGTEYDSFIETGYDIVEDLIAEKEINTIYTFLKRTEMNIIQNNEGGLVFDLPSGCFLRAKWQWADTSGSGEWSSPEQIYRLDRHWIPSGTGPFDYGFEVIQSINQVRGKGRAIVLRFESEDDNDFHLLGWAIPITMIVGA